MEGLLKFISEPGDMPQAAVDSARSGLRWLAENFATGNEAKFLRQQIDVARREIGKLTPNLEVYNRRMADVILARTKATEKLRKTGVEGVPAPETSEIAKLLARTPLFGKKAAIARALGRVLEGME
jgi:hypothetical protein